MIGCQNDVFDAEDLGDAWPLVDVGPNWVELLVEVVIGQFEKFWVLNFGIAAKAHFKKSAILLWRIHRIEWLK